MADAGRLSSWPHRAVLWACNCHFMQVPVTSISAFSVSVLASKHVADVGDQKV